MDHPIYFNIFLLTDSLKMLESLKDSYNVCDVVLSYRVIGTEIVQVLGLFSSSSDLFIFGPRYRTLNFVSRYLRRMYRIGYVGFRNELTMAE